MEAPIIQLENLSKTFRVARHHRGWGSTVRNLFNRQFQQVRAVDGLSFNIAAGELVGYLGPNGAGKSTTIKMLTGLLVPTSGSLAVKGYLPWRERQAYVQHIGAVFGQRTTLWWDLPVIESLTLHRHIYRIPRARFEQNLRTFRELLELDRFLDSPVRSLSLGQRMRADLAAAMLHDPALLFLDEPTIGLDVVAKERIRQFVQHINEQYGTTVLLTTHDLQDVARLCRRVMIIDQGRLVFDGELSALQARFGGLRRLVVDLAEAYEQVEVAGAEVVQREGMRVVYQFEAQAISASALIGRLSQRYRIRDLQVQEPSIEDTIRRIYEQRLLYDDPDQSSDPSL